MSSLVMQEGFLSQKLNFKKTVLLFCVHKALYYTNVHFPLLSIGAMSFGSISYETHTTLAKAMNK